MTKPQRIKLMSEWWPAACRAAGWPENDRNFRIAKLSEILGRPLSSASDLNNTSDVDAVKNHLLMLVDNVEATIETDNTRIGEARRLRHVIRTELLPCLALYEPDPEAYIRSIIQDKIRWSKTDRPTRPPTLDDLSAEPIFQRRPPCYALKESPSQLEQVLMTLNARLHAKRKEHGNTIHDMRTQAGLPCACRACCHNRIIPVNHVNQVTAEPAHASDPF